MTQDELLQEELSIEEMYKQEGKDALLNVFKEATDQKAVDTQHLVGKAFFGYKLYDYKEVVKEWLAKNLKPKAGVKPEYISIIEEIKAMYYDKNGDIDIDTLASMCAVNSLAVILNALSTDDEKLHYLNNAGRKVGLEIEHEYQLYCFEKWLEALPKDDKNKHAAKGVASRVGEHYRTYYLQQAMQKCKFEPPEWTDESMRTLGVALIVLAEASTGYFTLEHNYKAPESLVPTLHFLEAWERNENHILDKAKHYCPMIVEPAQWTPDGNGGYYGALAADISFLRLKHTNTAFVKSYEKKLKQLDVDNVYKAVNAIQATPYYINKEVLDVLKDCKYQGYIPCANEASKVIMVYGDNPPAKPDGDASEEIVKAYKKEKAAYMKKEKRRNSLKTKANTAINIARKFCKYEKIYFPWNMDFRGRIYPIPTFSPQGDDLCKGLLLFADTPPFQSKDDLKWLAITGANLAGVDKVSYDDRIKWVQEHEEAILASAADPMGYQWWLQQDEPVQMLAFCFEWKKAHEWIAEHGSIVGFVTGLPYAQDGTCSGLQHFSAILRDPIGGKAVNLIPQDKPNDIYAQVAEKVKEFLTEDAMNGTLDEWDEDKLRTKYGSKTLAQIWLNFGINRKVTKRPTMTLAYGAKKAGYTSQIMEDTIKKAIREQGESCVFTEANSYQCAQYMAGKIWDAVGGIVVKAVEGMDWLHKCAKLVTKNSNVVSWVTPLGLLLQQSYVKYEAKIIKLRCAGKRFRIYSPQKTGEIDKIKQANGIAPNFIHSMDACHLQMTVCRAKDAGINHFAMIHDSYGCPMSQAQLMYDIVRQAFIDMYTDYDVLEIFRECLQPLSNKTLPAPPEKGDLDLTCVKDSKYIFC